MTAGGGAGVSGNGSASVTITGTAAQINAALVGLAYTGNLNFNGVDTLTVVTGDGTATDTDTVAITVNPVNKPGQYRGPGATEASPRGTPPSPIGETGVSVADIDSTALTTHAEQNVSEAETILNVIAGGRRHRQRHRPAI